MLSALELCIKLNQNLRATTEPVLNFKSELHMQIKKHTPTAVGLILIGSVFLQVGCSSADSPYTLYRNSVTDENMRLHIATFDTSEGHDYNMSNCQITAELYQRQEGVKTKFWCEKGVYKK